MTTLREVKAAPDNDDQADGGGDKRNSSGTPRQVDPEAADIDLSRLASQGAQS